MPQKFFKKIVIFSLILSFYGLVASAQTKPNTNGADFFKNFLEKIDEVLGLTVEGTTKNLVEAIDRIGEECLRTANTSMSIVVDKTKITASCNSFIELYFKLKSRLKNIDQAIVFVDSALEGVDKLEDYFSKIGRFKSFCYTIGNLIGKVFRHDMDYGIRFTATDKKFPASHPVSMRDDRPVIEVVPSSFDELRDYLREIKKSLEELRTFPEELLTTYLYSKNYKDEIRTLYARKFLKNIVSTIQELELIKDSPLYSLLSSKQKKAIDDHLLELRSLVVSEPPKIEEFIDFLYVSERPDFNNPIIKKVVVDQLKRIIEEQDQYIRQLKNQSR